MSSEHKEKDPKPHIGGFYLKETIFLPPSGFLDHLCAYFHECGHIIGDKISFIDGTVLLPKEVQKTKLPLSFKEQLNLLKHLFTDGDGLMDAFSEQIAKRALKIFTKDNYPVDRIRLINLNDSQFQRWLEWFYSGSESSYTYDISEKGEFSPKYTDEGVLTELPACTVQVGCLTMLNNIISTHVFKLDFGEGLLKCSHNTALKIVLEAYEKGNIVLPSSLDLLKNLRENKSNLYSKISTE